MSPRILVTGGSGQIGWELVRALAPLGTVLAPGRAALDLSRPEALAAPLAELAPDVIVNTAAYTDVEGAEREPEAARTVNARAPGALAAHAAATGALLVHFSTDYVFDGRARAPYREDAPAAPLNVYGATKLEGEEAVRASGARHLVLRTSWVYGLRGRNFLRTILRRAREGGPPLTVVDDQRGAPTWSRMVAGATALVLARTLEAGAGDRRGGVYHLSAAGEATWHQFAAAIVRADAARGGYTPPEVAPVSSDAYASGARRPRYSVLDGGRLYADFGVRLPPWDAQLALALAEAGE